jgi:hypothetical protein
MQSFKQYLAEAEQHQFCPRVGDTVAFEINDELLIESQVIDTTHDGLVLNLDEQTIALLHSAQLLTLCEAEYQGRKVQLGKPKRTPGGPKKFSVYVKNPKTGNVKKVNFGDPNMEIKRDDPKRRKNFRARHGCGTGRASDRTKAAYWSCEMWGKTAVSKITKEHTEQS